MALAADYVELRCRSAFSFLEGGSLPEELVERALELGYSSLALADRNGLYGAPRFWKSARETPLRSLVGAEVEFREGRLLLLVASRGGYRRLCRLLTLGHSRSPIKGEFQLSLADLEGETGGLLCLAGGPFSPITNDLRYGRTTQARQRARVLHRLFGKRLWIDIQRSRNLRVERRSRALTDLAEAVHLPLVASGDVAFARPESRALVDLFSSIRLGRPLAELGRDAFSNTEQCLTDPRLMAERFRDLPEALRQSREIAEQLEFRMGDLGYRFPECPVPPGASSLQYLRELTLEGATRRYGSPLSSRVQSQLQHELTIIGKLGLEGYFLIVHDIVQFCRNAEILVQGRGSAANSAVCYSLGITAVDAVGMDLLFERFLSEERGEWPDIDLDLPSGAQREKVIQYLYRRYGGSHRAPADVPQAPTVGSGVAMTANVITYRRRSALREAAKGFGLSPLQVDRISRDLGRQGLAASEGSLAERFMEAGVDLNSRRMQLLVRAVESMEGLPRHLGQHSGGMILSAGRLDEVVPLEPAAMPGRSVVQWDKEDCADLGLIKIDLLGLGMLAVLERTIPLVRETSGVDLDLARLPPDDPKTYAMIQKADTVGVFQIESRAQMATLPRLKPATFYDLVVEVALIRPGPIVGKMVHPYLNRRSGREPVRYAHPSLEPILRRTLGVPLFQEQLLRIAVVAAGFRPGEAEELRRAMGFKRSTAKMKFLEAKLYRGLAERGIEAGAAEEIVQAITSFAMYGFPESHAASFALIAYASAYLKAHYPAAFLCSLLNCWPMGFYHPSTLISDAQRHGVEVLPVDVLRSSWDSTLEKGSCRGQPVVRLGLRFIHGLRAEQGVQLVRERERKVYGNLQDLAARSSLAQNELGRLARAGALASLGEGDRRAALWQISALPRPRETLLHGLETSPETAADAFIPPEMTPWEERLTDYAATGVTTEPHLLAELRSELRGKGVLSLSQMLALPDGASVEVAGAVIVRQRPQSAGGFCFLTLEDETGLANAFLVPQIFEQFRRVLQKYPLLILSGFLQKQEGVTHLKVDSLRPVGTEEHLPPARNFH
ncbi:MAG: error-prone DNA polymerase [Candidatus Binatia bacterium]|nr:error-prone DNA polymerase [Candidatus Binatia bacterium]MDG1960193.1 error-prone DNA polymerase [Candidatus Binatia bacterium]MDG2010616.1 error-prone DNA polymerase [Candidatus Binatia bacterium]